MACPQETPTSGGVTISQELPEQIRNDIVQSTQLLSSAKRREQEEGDIISASQSTPESRSSLPLPAPPSPTATSVPFLSSAPVLWEI